MIPPALSLPMSPIIIHRPRSSYTFHCSAHGTQLSSLHPLHVFFLRPAALFSPSLLPRGVCLLTLAYPLTLSFDVVSFSRSSTPDLPQELRSPSSPSAPYAEVLPTVCETSCSPICILFVLWTPCCMGLGGD